MISGADGEASTIGGFSPTGMGISAGVSAGAQIASAVVNAYYGVAMARVNFQMQRDRYQAEAEKANIDYQYKVGEINDAAKNMQFMQKAQVAFHRAQTRTAVLQGRVSETEASLDEAKQTRAVSKLANMKAFNRIKYFSGRPVTSP